MLLVKMLMFEYEVVLVSDMLCESSVLIMVCEMIFVVVVGGLFIELKILFEGMI